MSVMRLGLRAPSGDGPGGGPEPLLQHPGHERRARGARASCTSSAGTSTTTTPSSSRRAGSGWSSSATRSRTTTTWCATRSGPSSSAAPPAASAPGENLTVGDGVADHPALGAAPRAVQRDRVHRHRDRGDQPRPVAARHGRGIGAHWIDHALIAADDPGLVEKFFTEALDFHVAERAVTSIAAPRGARLLDGLRGVAARPGRDQGPQRASCTTSRSTSRTGTRSCGPGTS